MPLWSINYLSIYLCDEPQLSEQQLRLASTRAAYARWSRNLARRFAVARKKASLARGRRLRKTILLPSGRDSP